MYHFSKKIKCLNCGQNFRGVTKRGKRNYICTGYHNYRTCIRWKVDEEWLLELVLNHFVIGKYRNTGIVGGKEETDQTEPIPTEVLVGRVIEIRVNPIDEEVTIYFMDGSKTFMSKSRHAYWTDEASI